jgi:serine/threonine protein kinase
MRPQPRYQPGDTIGGRFQVHQALMGGMGEVYLCYDDEGHRAVALKTLQSKFLSKPSARQLFVQEAAIWVQLQEHPNIVQAYHYIEDVDGLPYLVLEWVIGPREYGPSLRSWLKHGPLELSLSLNFAIHLIQGMMHAQEIFPVLAHGDLKPENLLITQQRHLKITDFGLAKVLTTGEEHVRSVGTVGYSDPNLLAKMGGIVGTPAYMAPELWRGESSSTTSDIYAFGCILYEMLFGHLPFPFPTLAQQRLGHLEQEAVCPDTVPTQMRQLVLKCLAKAPGKRYSEWSQLLKSVIDAYTQLIQEEPTVIDVSQKRPEYWWKWHNQGASLFALMRYEDALQCFEQALTSNPDSVETWLGHGRTLVQLGRYKHALSSLERARGMGSSEAEDYIKECQLRLGIGPEPASPSDVLSETLAELNGLIANMWRDMKASGLHRPRDAVALGSVDVSHVNLSVLEELVGEMVSDDQRVRAQTAQIMLALPRRELEIVMKLAFEYIRDNWTYYDAFADTWSLAGTRVLDYLIAALEDGDWSLRFTAAQALSRFDDPGATRHFVEWFFSDLEWELYEEGFEIGQELADAIIQYAKSLGDNLLIKRIRNYWGPRENLEAALLKYGITD